MMLALTPELIDRNELSQMHGPYIGGLSGIEGANPAAYRWRYISSRSPNGVIGDAATATPEKGEKLEREGHLRAPLRDAQVLGGRSSSKRPVA